MTTTTPPPPILYTDLIERALREDLGRAGDLTTDAICSPDERATANLVARAPGVVAGLPMALSVFGHLDPDFEAEVSVGEGSRVQPGDAVATLYGRAAALLTGERTALNLLSRLSGIATTTREIVDRVAASPVAISETRKTTPGLRALEKYAVRVGGGVNHRYGLDDAVMIKDNHRRIAGGVVEAVRRVRASVSPMVTIEVEVDSLAELHELLPLDVDIVLLDNFTLDELRQAVELCRGRVQTEASGGITPQTVADVASTGVDRISLGWLTQSAPALDIGLDFAEIPPPVGAASSSRPR